MSNNTADNPDIDPDVDLDRAIDRAVREMVQVGPRAGLRGRVLARIAVPSARVMLLPRFAFAAAALAALMLVVVVLRLDAPAPVTVPVAHPVAPPAAVSPSAQPDRVDANKTNAHKTGVEFAAPPRSAPVVARKRGPTSEAIRMPPVANVFGPRDNRAAATNVPEPRDVPALSIPPLSGEARPVPQASPQPAPADRRPNISIELTISDQAGTSEPVTKVVTMIVADRQRGSVRSSGIVTTAPDESATVPPAERRTGVTLNVDATPSITPDGAILVSLTLEYEPRPGAGDARGRSQLNERMGVVLESGKGLVISQASDAGSNRRVTVELKATILR